ncbi:MAG: TerB family tellurite resistance protein [Saprospiraceae bacterium]|nr:TerB family tellurite resistance protein [Saprospiraceae bacterium]
MEPFKTGQGDEQKENTLRMLIALAKSDGSVDGRELLYILDVGHSFRIDAERVRALLYDDSGPFCVPEGEKERMTILYHLLFLTHTDGNFTPQEERYIYHFGFKLGFNESLIRDMILIMRKMPGNQVASVELLAAIKKYLN